MLVSSENGNVPLLALNRASVPGKLLVIRYCRMATARPWNCGEPDAVKKFANCCCEDVSWPKAERSCRIGTKADSWRSRRSKERNRKVLSFTTGAPSVAPYWARVKPAF